MENPIIVPFDLNTARKIKDGEIEGSVLINNIEIEFVYESKDCVGPYNLLFVRKDGYGISAIYADTEGCTLDGNALELKVEAGAYFKKGDILISTNGNPFIYNGIINREGDMGCIYGISAYGEITSEEIPIWTSVCGEDKSKYVRLATEEEKKSFAERIANTENLKKAGIIKQYLSEKSAGRWRVYTISWSIKFNGPLYGRTKQSIHLCFGISPLLDVVLVQY